MGLSKRRNVACQAFGNIIEWYDFMLYVYLVNTFNHLFFPSGYKMSFFMLWLIFGLSCLMRPVGSYIFGMVADKISSIKAQKYSILLMGVASTSLAILPGYQQWGWLSLVLLLLIRCLQVGCASAQFTLSIFSLADKNAAEPDGRAMVIPQLYATIGVLAAGVVMLFGRAWFPVMTGYWRYAYALNILFVATYYALLYYKQKPTAVRLPKVRQKDFKLILDQWKPITVIVLALALGFSFVYVCVILYLPTYLTSAMHYSKGFDLRVIFYCHILVAISLYFYSRVYNKMSATLRNALVLIPPIIISIYAILTCHYMSNLWLVFCVSSLLYAPYAFSVMHAMLVIFPENIRYRCGGLAYNIGVSLSSFFPIPLNYFVNHYGIDGFAYFFFFMTLIATPAIFLMVRKTGRQQAKKSQVQRSAAV